MNRGFWWYVKRPFQIAVAIPLLIVLWPLIVLRRAFRDLASFWRRRPPEAPEPEPVEQAQETTLFVPTLVQGLPHATSLPFDRALGGGIPMGRASYPSMPSFAEFWWKGKPYSRDAAINAARSDQAFAKALASDAKIERVRAERGRKAALYDTVDPKTDLQLLVVKRVEATGDAAGTGHCGTVLDATGFETEIQRKWGGGTYKVSGVYDGRVCVESVEIDGASKPIRPEPTEPAVPTHHPLPPPNVVRRKNRP